MPACKPEQLLGGGNCLVPKDVAICPECSGRLHAESCEWDTATDKPTLGGIYLNCQREGSIRHRGWQSDWQSVRDAVDKWAGAVPN